MPKRKQRTDNCPVGKRHLNVYVTLATGKILEAIRERDGVPFSGQVDRAMQAWAKSKGVEVEDDDAEAQP